MYQLLPCFVAGEIGVVNMRMEKVLCAPSIMTYHAEVSVKGKAQLDDIVLIKAELDDFYDGLEIIKSCARVLGSGASGMSKTVGDVVGIIQEGLKAADVQLLADQGIKNIEVECVCSAQHVGDCVELSWDDKL